MRRLVVLSAALLGLVAGCAAPVSGTPAPASDATPGASPAPSTIPLPPRPREVRLDGVEPCTLLTEAHRAELGLDRPPQTNSYSSGLYNGGRVQQCTTRGNEPRAVSASIFLSVTGGVEVFTARPINATVTPTEVRGFPAVTVVPERFDDFCNVIVDVAPGQVMDVLFSDGGREPAAPQPTLCEDARRTAGLAMDTLLAQR